MNLTKLFNILLLISLFLFFPLFRAPVTLDLVPFQTENVVVNLHGQSVVVISDSPQPIGLNVSYMNSITNQLDQIVDTFFIQSFEFELPFDKQGDFVFEFTSTTITGISINATGVPLPSLGIIGVVLFLRFLIAIKNSYTLSLEY